MGRDLAWSTRDLARHWRKTSSRFDTNRVETLCMGAVDRDRLATLWDRHADAVYAYARRRVGASDAPDVVAEVFAVAVAKAGSVPDDALPWLYRTAWNVIANHWRAEERRARLVEVVRQAADPGDYVVERMTMVDALAALSDSEREALLLTAWEGLDARRAAAAAGCSSATFAVRLHRARRRLDVLIARNDEEVAP
jgi:RNA polymerase sigma factor (sigma-70 family)